MYQQILIQWNNISCRFNCLNVSTLIWSYKQKEAFESVAGFEFMLKKNAHRTALKVILFYCSVLNEYMKRGISYHVSGNKFGDKTCCSNQIGCIFLFLMMSGFEQIILNHFTHCRWPNSSCFLKIILFISFSIAVLEIFKFTNILVYVLKDDDSALNHWYL